MNIKTYALLLLFLWKMDFLAYAQGQNWQQKVDYNITVQLIDSIRSLEGFAQIDYFNQSPDTLYQLYVHVYPNAYSSNKTAFAKDFLNAGNTDFQFAKERDKGYIKNINFLVNGEQVSWKLDKNNPDFGCIQLNKPLHPNEKLKISTPFFVKLPKLFSRSGYTNGVFSVTQWFPKVAVYDANGWHPLPYLEQGEFYDEWGDYDVKITVPKKYKVAATGILTKEIINEDSTQSFYFSQTNIHDFAWFASKKFNVFKDTMTLLSGKKIDLSTYTFSNGIFENANDLIKQAIVYYSENIGEYPYSQCSIVEAQQGMGGGMEYPMIANVETTSEIDYLKAVIIHEVGHNWFQGVLANNERLNPWLDEGINSYYEKRASEATNTRNEGFLETISSKKIGHFLGLNELPKNPLARYGILMQQRLGRFQPERLASEKLSLFNYGLGVYEGITMDFNVLEKYIGKEKLNAIIKAYFEEFKFRHVSENDFIHFFQNASGDDLSWFFDGLLNSEKRLDLSIKKVVKKEGNFEVHLKNKGDISVPFSISLKKSNEIKNTIWFPPFAKDTIIEIAVDDADQISIDEDWYLNELKRQNNFYKIGKSCPKFEKVKLQYLGSIENPKRSQVYFTPLLAGNKYDKFMFGMAIYNRFFPAKNLEYELMPMFAIGSKMLTGIFNVNYYLHPKIEHTREIKIGVHVSSFSFSEKPVLRNYVKVEPHINWAFKPGGENSNWTEDLQYRFIYIGNQVAKYDTSDFSKFELKRDKNWWNELSYKVVFDRKFTPFFANIKILQSTNYVRASLEGKVKLNYGNMKNKFFSIRLFAGGFLWRNADFRFGLHPDEAFGLSAITGENDFLRDGYYFGRSEQIGYSSKQLISGEGNFKTISTLQGVNIGKTANWLTTVNITADFPWKYLPIQFFADFGYVFNNSVPNGDLLPQKTFHYDAGASISLFEDALQIHFPLLMDKTFKTYYKSNGNKFKGKITYTFDLVKLNPHAMIRDIGRFISF